MGEQEDEDLITEYVYEAGTGQMSQIKYYRDDENSPDPNTPWVSFMYNRLGQKVTVTDAVGTRTFGYNSDLQLATESINSGGGGLYTKLITRSYEDWQGAVMAGRDLGFTIGPDAQNPDQDYSVEYAYFAPAIGQGRFKRVDGPGLPANGVQYTYVADSDLLDKLEFRGTMGAILARTTYTHEANRDLVTAVENQAGSGLPTVSKYDYGQGSGYDALGRRTSVVNTGTAFGDAALSLWSYNDRSELTSAYRHEGDDPADADDEITAQRRVYDYDQIGNREEATAGTGAGSTTYYCATNLNQYKYVGTTQPTCSSVTPNLAYDADGNLTADGVHAYAWDAENRLVAVTPAGAPVNGDKRLDFKYDYRSRRVEKVYSTYDDVGEVWVAQATYRFVYDEWNVVMVLDDNNDTLRKQTWGLDLSRDHDLSRDREGAEGIHGAGGIGGLLAVEETAEQDSPAYWFFYDANGNVGQAIKASDRSIAAKYEYDPYGNVIASSGDYADDNPIRFSTKWFDTELADTAQTGAIGESGLGYWGYRYYSPRLGRWINRDPIEEWGGILLYNFVGNSPVGWIDPRGDSGTAGSAKCSVSMAEGWGWGVHVTLDPLLNKMPCFKACIQAHEYVHVVQLTPCCLAAQMAWQVVMGSNAPAAQKIKAVGKILDGWDEFSSGNLDRFECQAYAVEIVVTTAMLANVVCCRELELLAFNLKSAIAKGKIHCGRTQAAVACPDFAAMVQGL